MAARRNLIGFCEIAVWTLFSLQAPAQERVVVGHGLVVETPETWSAVPESELSGPAANADFGTVVLMITDGNGNSIRIVRTTSRRLSRKLDHLRTRKSNSRDTAWEPRDADADAVLLLQDGLPGASPDPGTIERPSRLDFPIARCLGAQCRATDPDGRARQVRLWTWKVDRHHVYVVTASSRTDGAASAILRFMERLKFIRVC